MFLVSLVSIARDVGWVKGGGRGIKGSRDRGIEGTGGGGFRDSRIKGWELLKAGDGAETVFARFFVLG